jgi:cell surface protein SprA
LIRTFNIRILYVLLAAALFTSVHSFAQPKKDSTLRFPIKDRRGDPFTYRSNNPFDIRDTSVVKRSIEYDPTTKQYVIIEKIGGKIYRTPTTMNYDDFWKLEAKRSEQEYFRKRMAALSALNRKVARPKFKIFNKLFDRMFGIDSGGLKVSIKPQGSVDLTLGYQGQNIKNPTLPERARKNGGFDFDMNANINVIGNIGEKLKLPISYNTLANFDFENQLKLDYKGMDDEIIKSIEAGNISWQSRGTLIPSTQSLFGLKTQLQFGKLFITAAIANQRAQRQSVALQGGSATTQFTKKLDEYDENRHFLLGQYFKKNYNTVMKNLPVVNSQVQIQRIEIWVTNRTGTAQDTRDIVGLTDLGEVTPQNPINTSNGGTLPANGSNNLYSFLTSSTNNRNPALITSVLQGRGLQGVEDYEKTFARKLTTNEYFINRQAGFISLNVQLQPDEVLGVAYQYTYNGKVYQVGEFAQDVAVDSTSGVQKVLFLKLLKATSQRPPTPARPNLALWGLMMKNVYSLDVANLQATDFRLDVLYNAPSSGSTRYLPESSTGTSGRALLSILNLDRLNNRLDPQPDGVFDYIDSFTVLPQYGKIIFPVLEPFGKDLDALAYTGVAPAIRDKYVFFQLYDSIKAIAQTYANLDRFIAQGQVKGSGGSEIYLGAFNVPQGSVTVTAGGQVLREGADFTVDYNLGSVKILNQAILSSGLPVNVQFENNAGFGIQQRSFLGLRFDYLVSKKLTVGGSMVRLRERPFFTKMNYGEDPISNTMYGIDFSYRSPLPGLTRLLDKLPFYSTKVMSNITAYGEAAILKPGHPNQIGKGDEGLIFIDDFEGTRSSLDMRFPFVSWVLASTPKKPTEFPEADSINSLKYNFNRAKLAWYQIEPILQDKTSSTNPLRGNVTELSDPRIRQVQTKELYPQQTVQLTNALTQTFDLAYYPTDPGPYNYETRVGEINANGKLLNPAKRWGGIMRSIDQTDFETGNIETIEVLVQDPYLFKTTLSPGKLRINLGNVSEDILKDGRRFYENGLATPQVPAAVDKTSKWGTTPLNPIQLTQAFSNDVNDRPYQDVGLDGLVDSAEVSKRQADYLNPLAANFGTASPLYRKAINDPSNDNYVWYRDGGYDAAATGILGRYKNFNNPQGNSPVASTSSQFSSAATNYPDNEDLNRDNTLNENEEYYEYQLDIQPNMAVGSTKYLSQITKVNATYADGTAHTENWYLFRVPIKEYVSKIGNIPDFKSIRFMRMYMTGFTDSVVMRFGKLDLVRNQWRTFTYKLDSTGSYTPINPGSTTFNVTAVNLEENSSRTPINYVIPPGVERVATLSNNGVNLLQNEQAMSLQLKNLVKGDARAVFKTLNLDLRQYGQLSMYLHAESVVGLPKIGDGEMTAVVRIGQDFLNNYYEIRVPLKVTPPGSYPKGSEIVWYPSNNLDFALQELVALKNRRNATGNISTYYSETIGNKSFAIFGNPNLGEVKSMLIGVQNTMADAGSLGSAEVWVNELRLSKLDESGGWAALGRVDLQLADLGTVSVSANTYTAGFGTIEQKVNERARDNMIQYDAALTIDAGKLVPKKARLSIPIYASINKTTKRPEYDPYDKDVTYKDKINTAKSKAQKDSIKNTALDQMTIKTFNLTNVRIAPKGKPKIWSISNIDVSYNYLRTEISNPLVTKNDVTKHHGALGYTYNSSAKYWEPFKKMRNKSPWFGLVRDFNLNYNPSLLSFRADINRQFGVYVPRIVSADKKVQRVDTTYDKYFTFDRIYNFRWDVTRSLNLDFAATNNARVDEPFGALNTKEKKDTVKRNFWDGGRNTLYTQKATAAYTFPLGKLPLTDWITARYSYGTTYNWIGASRLATNLGNIIENGQDNTLNGEFDFTRLYQKSRFLRAVDDPNAAQLMQQKKDQKKQDEKNKKAGTNVVNPTTVTTNANQPTIPKRSEVIKDKDGKQLVGKAKKEALQKWRQQKRDARAAKRLAHANKPMELPGTVRAAGHVLTMVKRASVNYTEGYRSRIPGYMDSTRALGQNFRSMQPGLGYVFGKQPDTGWLNMKAREGVLTKDSTFNIMFRQSFTQKLSITAQLEPIKEFIIDLNLDKTYNKDYTELFKDTTGSGTKFRHLSPLANGGFSVSYIAFNTLFQQTKPNEVSETFKTFSANRLTVANRLATANPYYTGQRNNDGFPTGYGRNSQDVLIPAFLAAYTGKDAASVSLINQSNPTIKTNPFSGIKPMPNWRMTYTGLTKIPALAKKFSTISLSHSYNGTLSMNSFTSALNYNDPLGLSAPSFIDATSGNYVPYFLLPNLTIQEAFSPLIGIDITTTNQMNLKFEYKKSRQLSLSLIDYQLSEQNSTEFVIGGAWRKRGVKFPFKIPFTKGKKLENDLNIRLDLAMRDDVQSNSRLDQANAYSTGGQKVITIQPSIDYVLNNRVNLKLFFDQRRVTPYISTAAPTVNTRAGLQIRISLAQ